MDIKQMSWNSKSTVEQNSIKRFVYFVQKLEEKLLSVKGIHEKLNELLGIVTKTHDNILQELTNIKTVLNQSNIEQHEPDDDEIIPIDATRSEWEDDDDDDEEIISVSPSDKSSPSVDRLEQFRLNSVSSSDSNKRSSNLKKSDQSTSRTRSPKSVTFVLEQKPTQPTKKEKINEITTPMIPSLTSLVFSKQNSVDPPPKLGKMLTDIRIHEIESKNGDYIRLLNVSNSDDYDLGEHFLQQNLNSKTLCRFRFPSNTIIRAGQTVTVWCGHFKDITPQPPYVFLWKEQIKWHTESQCLTSLIKPNGQPIAWFRNSDRVNPDQSSSDILFVHSQSNIGSADLSNALSNSIKNSSRPSTRQSRLSVFTLNASHKPPFAHSPNNPIHPDHHGTTIGIPYDLRSQMHQRGGISQLLKRPKSSPFASHTGCKQDLISMNFLRTQGEKQTTIQT